jgi:hypothetical protein
MTDEIQENFIKRFGKIFEKTNPKWPEVAPIFYWLKHEASCARELDHLRTIDRLRRLTEERFSQFKRLQKNVDKESRKVNEEQRKRDEQLRTTASRKGGKVAVFGGESEKERVPPSK